MNANEIVKDKLNDLNATVLALLPNSRERSSLITKLDEARHWLADIPATPVLDAGDNASVEQH